MSNELEILNEHRCFGGVQRFYRHNSSAIGLPMRFSAFIPEAAAAGGARLPVLFFLAGLTCTEEVFMVKAGAQRLAALHGIMLVAPDTSPRGAGVPGEDDGWDLGTGAGFYLDATQEPWRTHYRWKAMWRANCSTLPRPLCLAMRRGRGCLGIPWEGTARWCWHSVIGTNTVRCRRLHPLPHHPGAHGAIKRLAPIWVAIRGTGLSTTPRC